MFKLRSLKENNCLPFGRHLRRLCAVQGRGGVLVAPEASVGADRHTSTPGQDADQNRRRFEAPSCRRFNSKSSSEKHPEAVVWRGSWPTLAKPILTKTDFGQPDFEERGRLRSISTSASFFVRLRPISTSANFDLLNFGTTKGGPQKGAPKGGSRREGAQNFSLFFPLPPQFWGLDMCMFGEPKRAHFRVPAFEKPPKFNERISKRGREE